MEDDATSTVEHVVWKNQNRSGKGRDDDDGQADIKLVLEVYTCPL